VPTPGDPSVTFPVAEMLTRMDAKNDAGMARLEHKLDEISGRLDSKADQARVDQLSQQLVDLALNGSRTAREAAAEVHGLDSRLRVVETDGAVGKAIAQARASMIGTAIAIIAAAAAVILALRH
jgi:hypothetical protein